MKLGIYGGTFNPPHLGHLTSARLALDALGLDELRFVPAALPPHKRLPPDAPGPEARLEMVELAADGLLLPGRVSVSGMELSRPGKSYTADTLAQLHAQNPGAELWLMMGTDMFLTLQNWREPERITALAGICARPSGRRCASSNCPRWWTCPPPGCGSCWPAARVGSTCPRRCTAISSATGSTGRGGI